VATIGKSWTSSPIALEEDGDYTVRLDEPEEGWTAYFVEMAFDLGAPVPLMVTTEVYVVPDVYTDGSKTKTRRAKS
jgi:PhoPQ-activated pathogenicity-related protein